MNIVSINQASQIIKNGGIIIFPTETIYGIGANAFNREAVEKIFFAKNRNKDNPLIIHIYSKDQIKDYLIDDELSDILLSELAPGPITILYKKKDKNNKIFNSLDDYLPDLALRIPANPKAQEFLKACNLPIAAPSANLSTRPSATNINMLNDLKVDGIIIDEHSEIGIESTIIKFDKKDTIYIYRKGIIEENDIKKALDKHRIKNIKIQYLTKDIKSPGLLYPHYKPNCKVKLAIDLTIVEKNVGIISCQELNKYKFENNLTKNTKTLKEYIRYLYYYMFLLEKEGVKVIYLQDIQQDQLNLQGAKALKDRIDRASK